jgi:adenylate kinase
MELPAILFFGPPGIGKGTLLGRLAHEHPDHFVHVSSGDLVRSWLSIDGSAQRAYRADYAAGKLLDDAQLCTIVQGELGALVDAGVIRGQYLLPDGFPRTPAQARMLSGGSPSVRVDFMIEMSGVPEGELHARIEGRAQGAIAAGQTPRADDLRYDARAQRLAEYSAQLATLDAYAVPRFMLSCVGSKDDIYHRALTLLGPYCTW